MKKHLAMLVLLGSSLSAEVAAQTLYATTDGPDPGSLYRIALDGTPTLVGALLDGANHAFSITGISQFGGGPVYGVTANLSPTSPRSLVTVNITTARVTVVGSLGLNSPQSPVSDIVFLNDGTLFGFAPRVGQFVTVNTGTGAATKIGSPSQYFSDSLAVSPIALTFTGRSPAGPTGPADGGAVPVNAILPRIGQLQTTLPAGTVFSTTNGPCGELDWVNPANGAVTAITALSSGNCNFAISGLRFSAGGTLYCTLSQGRDPFLATIGPSGVVTTIGTGLIPAGVGSLAFASPATTSIPAVSTPVLLAMIAGLLLLGLLQFRRPQHS